MDDNVCQDGKNNARHASSAKRGRNHPATDELAEQEALKGFVDESLGRDERTRRSERRNHLSTTIRALTTKHERAVAEGAGLSTSNSNRGIERSLSPSNRISAKYASLARNSRSGQAGEPRTSKNGRTAAAAAAAASIDTTVTETPNSPITETTSIHRIDSFSSNTSSQDQNGVKFTITETASINTTDSFSTSTSSQDQNGTKFTALARRRNVRSALLGKSKPVENERASNTTTDTVTPTSPTTETASVRTTDSVSSNIGAKYTAFVRRRNVQSGQAGESKPVENVHATAASNPTTITVIPTSPTTETACVHTTDIDSSNTSSQERIGAKYNALARRRNVRSGQVGESKPAENNERAADTTTATATPTASTAETGSVNAINGGSSNSSNNTFAQNRVGAKYAALTKRRNVRSVQVKSKTSQNERAAAATTTDTDTNTSIVTAPTVETNTASEIANASDDVDATEITSAIVCVDVAESGSSITFAQYRIPAEFTPFVANFELDQASEPKTAENEHFASTDDINTTTASASPCENIDANASGSDTFAQDRIAAKYAAFAANFELDQAGESKIVDDERDAASNTASVAATATAAANATGSGGSNTFVQDFKDQIDAKYAAFAAYFGLDQAEESKTAEDERDAASNTATVATAATANATRSGGSNTFVQDFKARIDAKHAAFAANVGLGQVGRAATIPTVTPSASPSSSGAESTGDGRNDAASTGDGRNDAPSTGEGDLAVADRLERLRRHAPRRRQTPGVHHIPGNSGTLYPSMRMLARRLTDRMNAEPSSDNMYVVPRACPVEAEPAPEYVTAVRATPWIKETKTKLTFACFFVAAVATAASLYLMLRPSKVCPNGAFSSPREALGIEIINMIDQSQNGTSSLRYKALEWIDKHHEERDLCNPYEIRQKYVVVLLYYATNGSGWDEQAGFLNETTSVCKWNTGVIGLFCDENDHNITTITLGDNNLVGSIPPEIGYLTDLMALGLRPSSMTGTLPQQIGNLARLQVLMIDGNITGTIPTELGGLSQLYWLDLSNMMLTGNIPHEIGNLKNLLKLELFQNELHGTIPTSLRRLSKLKHLLVSSNLLTGTIPSELGNLTMLEKLKLDHNFLTGTIPFEIENLVQLDSMRMGENNLIGSFPSELCCLPRLSELHLASNSLNGTIPVEIGNLKKLEKLDLSENIFTGTIPAQLADIASLENLNLALNKLSGTIPIEFGSTESIEYLLLCCNNLTGAFPHQVDSETSFLVVEIFDNNVTGNFSSLCKKQLRLKINCGNDDDKCECCKCVS